MIRLLSTDFDGTLVDHYADPPVERELIECVAELRADGAVWAINTGRAVHHIEEGLEEFGFLIRPDFILTSERDVFRPAGAGWDPYGDWNARCAAAHEELMAQAGSLIEQIAHFLEHETEARMICEEEGPVGIIARDEAEMDRVVDFIEAAKHQLPEFHYQRNTMYLRFCHVAYHKGAALGELARLLEIPRSAIFAAGDHFNDLSMLDGKYAAMAACPANAVEPVKTAVRSAGGYVAEASCSRGVAEALRHFRSADRAAADIGGAR